MKFKAKDLMEATDKIAEYTDNGYELKNYVPNEDGSYDVEMIKSLEKTEGEKMSDLFETVEFQKKLIRVMGLSLEKLDPTRSVDEWIAFASLVVATSEAENDGKGPGGAGDDSVN